MSPTIVPNEGIGKKIKELSKLKMLHNRDAQSCSISNAVNNLNLHGQQPVRRSLSFLKIDKIITPAGLTLNLPVKSRRERDEVPQHSQTHCEMCCCKKAETSLEKLQQEINDLKELVKMMRNSNNNNNNCNYSIDITNNSCINNIYNVDNSNTIGNKNNTVPQAGSSPMTYQVAPFLIPPPPPPPPPPPASHFVQVDPLGALKEARRKRKRLLEPAKRESKVDMSEILREMKHVTLKQVPRSPGGTPYRAKTPSHQSGNDAGSFLARALQKRYESLASPESSPSSHRQTSPASSPRGVF